MNVMAHCVTDLASLRAYIAYCRASDPDLKSVQLPWNSWCAFRRCKADREFTWHAVDRGLYPQYDGVLLEMRKPDGVSYWARPW